MVDSSQIRVRVFEERKRKTERRKRKEGEKWFEPDHFSFIYTRKPGRFEPDPFSLAFSLWI